MTALALRTRSRYSAIPYFPGRYKFLFGATLLLILVVSVLESFSLAAFFPVLASLLEISSE